VKAIVFLGGGRITSALLAGLKRASYKGPIVVHDRNAHKLHALKKEFGVAVEPDLARAIAQAALLMIAVRPCDVGSVLAQARELMVQSRGGRPAQSLLACSLAAGIPLKSLRAGLSRPVRWARAMPSPVARSRRGLTVVAFEPSFPANARKQIKNLFSNVSSVLEIPESKFDIFTATYSCSHGYHALAVLAKAAQKLGLDRKTAFTAAAHGLADGIFAWREENAVLEELLHEAATPGGISASVMKTMDEQGYVRAVERGLRAGVARARKNARS
jgi:pyrroline-5-carboxylate reductase